MNTHQTFLPRRPADICHFAFTVLAVLALGCLFFLAAFATLLSLVLWPLAGLSLVFAALATLAVIRAQHLSDERILLNPVALTWLAYRAGAGTDISYPRRVLGALAIGVLSPLMCLSSWAIGHPYRAPMVPGDP